MPHAASLILPTLDPAVPAHLTLPAIDEHRAARLVLLLEQLGHLGPDDWRLARLSPIPNFPQALLARALENWVKTETGPLKLLGFDLGLSTDFGRIAEEFSEAWINPGDCEDTVALVARPNEEMPELFLKAPVLALEALAPGLGETALHYLLNTLRGTLPSASMDKALWLIQNFHWCGCETMEDYLQAYYDVDPTDTAAIADLVESEEIYLMSTFEAAVPRLAHSPQARVSPRELLTLRDDPRQPALVKDLAHVLLELSQSEPAWRFPNETYGTECLAHSCLLRWCPEDSVVQHFDNYFYFHYQYGEGFTEESYGIDLLDLNQPAPKLQQQLTELSHGLRRVGLADQLLHMLQERS